MVIADYNCVDQSKLKKTHCLRVFLLLGSRLPHMWFWGLGLICNFLVYYVKRLWQSTVKSAIQIKCNWIKSILIIMYCTLMLYLFQTFLQELYIWCFWLIRWSWALVTSHDSDTVSITSHVVPLCLEANHSGNNPTLAVSIKPAQRTKHIRGQN